MADPESSTIDELMASESVPVTRTRAQYIALIVGIAITAALGSFLLLVVLPVVAEAIAWFLQVAPLLTTP